VHQAGHGYDSCVPPEVTDCETYVHVCFTTSELFRLSSSRLCCIAGCHPISVRAPDWNGQYSSRLLGTDQAMPLRIDPRDLLFTSGLSAQSGSFVQTAVARAGRIHLWVLVLHSWALSTVNQVPMQFHTAVNRSETRQSVHRCWWCVPPAGQLKHRRGPTTHKIRCAALERVPLQHEDCSVHAAS
jgi:hypothetical protein